MTLTILHFSSSGRSRFHFKPSTSILITLTGRSAMGVLMRSVGGSSLRITCLELVLPDPAAPMKSILPISDFTWPCFIASSKKRRDLAKRIQEVCIHRAHIGTVHIARYIGQPLLCAVMRTAMKLLY